MLDLASLSASKCHIDLLKNCLQLYILVSFLNTPTDVKELLCTVNMESVRHSCELFTKVGG